MAAAVDELEIRLLGPVEAVRSGQSVALGGARQRALLALLALDPARPVAIDRLVDDLWGGQPPPGAETSLRSYVTRLRAALGDAAPIRSSGGGYALEAPPACIDAKRFANLAAEGSAALASGHHRRAATLIGQALAMWRGRPFGELSTDGPLRIEADRLEAMMLDAIEHRIDADLELGQADSLVDELEGLVREHPYREAFWRQLMLAFYRTERQSDALGAFLRARDALDEQLGVEPGPELQALQAAILRHDVAAPAAPAAPRNLPAPLTSFIGRDSELAEVSNLLGSSRLVTLTGVGGVGKTRLAIEAARRSLDRFRNGVVFVDLTPLADSNLVASSIAAGVEIGSEATDVAGPLGEYLRDREILLVIDNCEHLRGAVAGLLERLLPAAPDLRVIATSREVLGVGGEVTFTVPPLHLAMRQPHDQRESEAVRLFLDRMHDVRRDLADDGAAIETVRRICADLEGIPLAIELAAARARVLSIPEIAARLGDRLAFLVSWRTLAPSRHRTLRAALDWSYDLLASDERELLADLSVFSGGCTLDAAASVCLRGDRAAAMESLQRLVEASLVSIDTSVQPTRYRMLETVREYAAERLGERRSGVELSLADWVRDLLASLIPDGTKPIPPESYRRLDAEVDNMRAALRRAALEADPGRELEIAGAAWKYWWVRGLITEAHAVYDGIVERRGIVDTPNGLRVARAAASLAKTAGDVDRAHTLAEQALEAGRHAGNLFEQASVLNVLGVIARGEGRLDDAQTHFDEAIDLASKLSNHELVAMYRGNLATVHMDAGRLEAARALFTQNLESQGPDGLSDANGYTRLNLGELELQAGAPQVAERHFLAAVEAFRSVGNKGRLANSLQGLAAVEASTARAELAARHLGEAAAVMGTTSGLLTPDSPLEGMAIESARAALGDEAFERLFDEGRLGGEALRAERLRA